MTGKLYRVWFLTLLGGFAAGLHYSQLQPPAEGFTANPFTVVAGFIVPFAYTVLSAVNR